MPELYDLAAARKRRKAKPKTETPVVEEVARPSGQTAISYLVR